MALRHLLPQQAIGSHHLGLGAAEHHLAGIVVQHQDVVADGVEGVHIAPRQPGGGVGNGGLFLVKDLIAQPLGLAHVARRAASRTFKATETAEHHRLTEGDGFAMADAGIGAQV